MMTNETQHACRRKTLIYGAVAFLALLSASANLEAYLYLPGIVWIVGGVVVAGCWAHEKFCRFDLRDRSDDEDYECSACGLFGHKLPWILLVGGGLANLADLTEEWAPYTAYAIAIALLSLAGSFFLMRISDD